MVELLRLLAFTNKALFAPGLAMALLAALPMVADAQIVRSRSSRVNTNYIYGSPISTPIPVDPTTGLSRSRSSSIYYNSDIPARIYKRSGRSRQDIRDSILVNPTIIDSRISDSVLINPRVIDRGYRRVIRDPRVYYRHDHGYPYNYYRGYHR